MNVFETHRLIVRRSAPTDEDVEFLYRLWTDPQVMVNVGFPKGLKTTRDKVRAQLAAQPDTEFGIRLLVSLKEDHTIIGECMLGKPNEEGVSETDVKLLPSFWGRGYGTEIKQALVDYIFTHTDALAVKATPSRGNRASQRMQEKTGGQRVGEGVFTFPEAMRHCTCEVPYYEYRAERRDWLRRKRDQGQR